jgi:predicted anti-sigma-YlaC factor YlaD
MRHNLNGIETDNRKRPMDCRQVRALLVAYLDNEVGGQRRADIESHLAGCQKCRGERDSIRTAQQAVRTEFAARAGRVELPTRAWEQLQPGLDIYRPSMLFLFRRRRWRVVATVVLLALVVAGLLWASGIWMRSP